MVWDTSPPELVERFTAVVPAAPDVVQRSMFGYPSATVHMFMGLHQDRMVIRLEPGYLDAFLAAGASPFEPMPGRPMAGFGVVPAAVLADEGALRSWIDTALEDARARPPKVVKPRKAARRTP